MGKWKIKFESVTKKDGWRFGILVSSFEPWNLISVSLSLFFLELSLIIEKKEK